MGLGRRYASGWADTLRGRSWGVDLLAGVTVSAVALPLNVGLAIASGMPPSAGLVAGIVGGVVAALFGSSQFQVSGPAAALSVMVLALARECGVGGVAAATMIIGVVEIVLALCLAGRIVRHVPESVLAGFTTGVGLKLLDQQFPELLGFPEVVDWAPDHHADTIDVVTMMHHPRWLHDVSWHAVFCGLFVIHLVTVTRSMKRFPSAIVAIALVTYVSLYLGWDVERVASVGEVPSRLPSLSWPTVPDGKWVSLLVGTAPLALLAAAESLLSASAVDRMAKARRPHDANVELAGQGFANLAVGLVAGMPVTGVIARSSVNVQSGARSRLAAIFHALFLLGMVMFASASISRVPLAAIAGLLCVIGFRLVEVRTLLRLAREEKLEALAFLTAAGGTVSGHLMFGLVAGLLVHFANVRWNGHAVGSTLDEEKRDGGLASP